jgi:hypothetical protein
MDNAYTRLPDGTASRFTHESYYGSRPASTVYANRPDGSQYDLRTGAMGQRDTYYDQQAGSGYYGPPGQGPRRGWPRMYPEPQYGPGQRHPNVNESPIPSNHRSYETVTSAAGSGSSADPAGYQTDPTSSDNSSIERVQSPPKRHTEPANDYGIGFSQGPAYQPQQFVLGMQGAAGMNGRGVNDHQASGALGNGMNPPPVPHKDQGTVLRKPISTDHVQQQRPAAPEKRKSWLARRFSRHG